MEFLEKILSGDHSAILEMLAPGAWIDLQSIGSTTGGIIQSELLLLQQSYFEKQISEFELFRRFEDDRSLVLEYHLTLTNSNDLPLVVILDKHDKSFSSIRTYHSVYPITTGHEFRALLFLDEVTLRHPKAVADYFKAVAEGNLYDTMDTLAQDDDVYFREPAGWRWCHKGREQLNEHYKHFFSDGGIPLKFHHTVYNPADAVFAVEYSCNQWGNAHFRSQAGMSVYEFDRESGKITAIRVYDNIDPIYT